MRRIALLTVLAAFFPGAALAQVDARPAAPPPAAQLAGIPLFEVPKVDLAKALAQDRKRQLDDEVAHFAVPVAVAVTPWGEYGKSGVRDGDVPGWDVSLKELRWRLRLRSPGALSLSLAFTLFEMPEGGRLTVYSADGKERIGPYTAADNEAHRQLWTPPLQADDLILELTLSAESPEALEDRLDEIELRLTRIHHGYSGFGDEKPLSGSCQRDVACTNLSAWRDVARSVGLVSIEGVRFCSGFMVNNTAHDGKPLFVTAQHCGVNRRNAPSVVVMWNHESPDCRAGLEGDLAAERRPSQTSQTGAALRAAYRPTDVVLLELDDLPDSAWNIHYAGWDRSAVVPAGAMVIHHPNTDLKRASYDQDRVRKTFFLRDREADAGDHLRVGAWETGTTEGGSSGSPLFNENQRVIGQLHGGYARCGASDADWFGRLAVSWQGNGRRSGRLADWLDPLGTEAVTLDGLDTDELDIRR